MRFIHLFLTGYFILIIGITAALWQLGVLGHVAPIWIGVGAMVAIGVGIMLSVSSGKPTVTEMCLSSGHDARLQPVALWRAPVHLESCAFVDTNGYLRRADMHAVVWLEHAASKRETPEPQRVCKAEAVRLG